MHEEMGKEVCNKIFIQRCKKTYIFYYLQTF